MKPFTDQEMEVQIGHMLRFGVTLAAIVVFFGGIFYLLHSSGPVPDYSHFHGTPEQLRTLAGVVRGAIHLNAESVIQLGILLLIATPVTRVAFCVWGFTRQRDRLYVAVSSVVFLILIYSLVRGGR
ncbi:MAG TPA: DUF1634 domain-containing protein [Silvibacterium sp.]|nr:DUF1634 domain-containing protein [Silvibacterium sp.]